MVSRLGENFSSRLEYSVLYIKMFIRQEITDMKVSTSYADC